MNCSKCNSPNCRSFEILHQTGTSSSSSSEIGTVRSQTELAKRCNPPGNYFVSIGTGLSLMIGVLAVPVGCMSTTHNGTGFPANVGYGFLAMFITSFVLIVAIKTLSRSLGFTGSYERKLKQWHKSFMCVDCGNVMMNEQE